MEIKTNFESIPDKRVENRGLYIVEYTDKRLIKLYENAKICSNDHCLTFTEDLREYGYLVNDGQISKLILCMNLRSIDNFLFCEYTSEYACYKKKDKFEGDCELRQSDFVPSPSFHYEGDSMYYYSDGAQIVQKFYLTEKERNQLIDKYVPEEDSALLKFLKSNGTRYYYFMVHVIMIIVSLVAIIRKGIKRFRKWTEQLETKTIERNHEEESRQKRLEDIELSVNLLRSELAELPVASGKRHRVQFYK